MKIDTDLKVKLNSVKFPKKKSASKENFDSMLEEESASATQGISSVNVIDSLLALQEIQTTTINKKQVEHGYHILDQLRKLQLAIICGDVSEQSLQLLTNMIRTSKDKLIDPALSHILNEIELRAEIELAKISRRKK